MDPAVARCLQKLSARESLYYRQGRGGSTEHRGHVCYNVSNTRDTENTTSKRRHAETTPPGLLPSEGPRSSKCRKLQEGNAQEEVPLKKGLPEKSAAFEDPRFINGVLVRARCASDLLKVLEDKSTRFNGVNVSTMIHRLAKQPDGRKVLSENASIMQKLGQLVVDKIEEFTPQHVANIVLGYAKLGRMPREQIWTALEGALLRTAAQLNPQEVANTVWGYATLGRMPC